MAIQIIISGTTYNIPVQGEEEPWGPSITSILQALAAASTTTNAPGDITTTSFSIANNISSPSPITGMNFDPAIVRSSTVTYSIDRSAGGVELAEQGFLLVSYNTTSNSWELARYGSGSDAGLTFTISSGQISYTSSNLTGSSYQGLMKFSAKSSSQT